MARQWNIAAGGEFTQVIPGVGTDYPHTFSCFFRKVTSAQTGVLMGCGDEITSGVWNTFYMGLNSDNTVFCTSADRFGASFTAVGGSYSLNTWHWLFARFPSANSRHIYLDGLLVGSESTIHANGNTFDTVWIGHEDNNNHIRRCRIAWPAWWNADDGGGSSVTRPLMAGMDPRARNPKELRFFSRLTNKANTDVGFSEIPGGAMTKAGVVTIANPSNPHFLTSLHNGHIA